MGPCCRRPLSGREKIRLWCHMPSRLHRHAPLEIQIIQEDCLKSFSVFFLCTFRIWVRKFFSRFITTPELLCGRSVLVFCKAISLLMWKIKLYSTFSFDFSCLFCPWSSLSLCVVPSGWCCLLEVTSSAFTGVR